MIESDLDLGWAPAFEDNDPKKVLSVVIVVIERRFDKTLVPVPTYVESGGQGTYL